MASTEFDIKTASRLYYGGYYDRLVEAREALELLFGEMEYELLNKNGRNPIEYIKARIKTPASMEEKLARLNKDGLRLGAQDLFDGCGTRLVCTFIDDCYTIKSWLAARPDLILVAEKDYIRHPKPSGYRSYHLQVRVRTDIGQWINAEIQIRTISMDCWATLEHHLRYKKHLLNESMMASELKRCADELASTDINLMIIRDRIVYDKEDDSDETLTGR